MASTKPLLVQPGSWYAWYMLPGYSGDFFPYVSPIKIYKVEPEKSGRSTLVLSFYNASYATGVKDVHLRMRVVTRRPSHILVELLNDSDDVMTRDAVIGRIGHEWLEAHVGTVDGVVRPGRDAHQAEIDDYLERADRALNAW